MQIIILGAGQIGRALALGLAHENHDITLIDLKEQRLRNVEQNEGLRTINGNGAHPVILEIAGIKDADMLVALTESDEVNMVACRIAKEHYNTTRCISRLRSSEYLKPEEPDMAKLMSIDRMISPERIAAQHVERLVRRPGALHSVEFFDGMAELVAVRIQPGAPAAGRTLGNLYAELPETPMYVAAVYRDEQLTPLDEEVRLRAHDEMFVLAPKDQVETIVQQTRTHLHPIRHILIAGGGNVGFGVASQLEDSHHIKLIEQDARRAHYLSTQLKKTLVIQGNAYDERLMLNEDIRGMDIFCALTSNEEANVLAAMEARRLGASTTLALVNRPSYIALVTRAIDIAISRQQDTLSDLLAYIRRGEVLVAHSLHRGSAEALEIRAKETSPITEKPCGKLKLPDGLHIAALLHEGELVFPNPATRVQPGDHVIMFVSNKRQMRDLEKLFQVSATFLG